MRSRLPRFLLPVLLLMLFVAPVAPATGSTAFSFTWMGTPASPQSVVPAGWDVQIHKRDVGDTMETMAAQHGTDCAAPPATHQISTLADGVFICKNHLMTAIGDSGYGEIALTSDHMADWSAGTVSIQVSVSTLQLNNSDFVELWVSPFADNQTLPFSETDPDLQGPPRNALRFSFNHDGPINGTYEGDVARVDNFQSSKLPKAVTAALSSVVPPSAAVRTTYEIDISQSHIRFGLPALNLWWTDTNIAPLSFSQGVVQLTHHSYNPNKHNPGLGVDTWHWSNFYISNAVPFTIINGAERSVHDGGATTVHFPAAAPAPSNLRFSGIGNISVSYNGGATWAAAQKQSQIGTHEEHFSSYWTPIPAGTQSVMFRGSNWYGGPWWVRDPAIWSLSPVGSISSLPSPTPVVNPPPTAPPSPTSPPTPSPVAIPMNGVPCTITMNGKTMTGICSGTFQQK